MIRSPNANAKSMNLPIKEIGSTVTRRGISSPRRNSSCLPLFANSNTDAEIFLMP